MPGGSAGEGASKPDVGASIGTADTSIACSRRRDTRSAGDGFGTSRVVSPTYLGNDELTAAVGEFSSTWTTALERRLDGLNWFADCLSQTADWYEENETMMSSELDQMIWG